MAVDAGAHTTSVAPADVAADGHVGALMGGAAAGNVGADDVIDAVDILDDTIVADVPPRAADVLNHSGERGGVRTRARVRARFSRSQSSRVVTSVFVIVTSTLASKHAVTTPRSKTGSISASRSGGTFSRRF